MSDNKRVGINDNMRSPLLRALSLVFKIIVFPVYILHYFIGKLVAKSRFSIRLSLSLMYLKIVIRTLALTGFLIFLAYGVHKAYFVFEIYNMVAGQVEQIGHIETTEQIEFILKTRNETLKGVSEDKYFVVMYDKDKKFLFSSNSAGLTRSSNPDNSIMGEKELKYRNIAGFAVIGDRYFVILDKKASVSEQAFFLNIYTDITDEINDIKNLLVIILLVNTGGIIFAFILSLITGRNVFLPIKEMAEAARSISENNMNVRLNVSDSKNELKGLAMTFNEMMDRIEDGYNRQKQFVSDVSHELRTPIAVLQGYIDMLNRWGKNDREVLQESIDAIKNETENMKDLVENLLFLARSDRGTLALQKERFSLTSLLKEAIKETVIIDKKHTVSCNIKDGIEIHADRNRIKQAVRIFLDNAIKYTPEGGEITVNLIVEKKHAVIEIADTGIGMTEEEMKHIFDRFYRSDKSRKREKGGHGLGLTIAKIIVLSHGGKINVRSKPLEGTRIKVFFPVA